MTVQAEISVVTYEGDGVTTVFPFGYRILEPENVQVIINDIPQETGFTTIMNADQEIQPGGTVTFDVSPSNGALIVLYRLILPNQEIDYTAYDSFPAETHELGLDKLTMLNQQSSQLINHAIHFQLNENPELVNTLLPPPAERANRFMYFDGAGNLIMFDAVIAQPGVLRIDVHADSQSMVRFNYPSTPEYPELQMLYNGPLGTVKLDEQGKIPSDLLNFIGMRMLGPYRGDDLCPKLGDEGGECVAPDTRNPSQRFSEIADDFEGGDYFALTFQDPEVDGTMELYAEVGAAQTTIVTVAEKDAIVYLTEFVDPEPPGDILIHEGWYHIPGLIDLSSAEFVSYDDTDNTFVLGDNVQVALDVIDTHLISISVSLMTQFGQNRFTYPLTDANLSLASGHYFLTGTALNIPVDGQDFSLTNLAANANRMTQIAISHSEPGQTFTRYFTDGFGFSAWRRLAQESEIDNLQNQLDNFVTFPVGTQMLFHQAEAPSGWVKRTDLIDRGLRVTNGSGGGGAGSVPFSTLFARTSSDPHTLIESEIPVHTHLGGHWTGNHNSEGGPNQTMAQPGNNQAKTATDGTGGGLGHTHNIDLRLQYQDVIICTKE